MRKFILVAALAWAATAPLAAQTSHSLRDARPDAGLAKVGQVPDAGNLSPAKPPKISSNSVVGCVTLYIPSPAPHAVNICGADGDSAVQPTYQYLGIRYARAARWGAPAAENPVSQEAVSYGSECPQASATAPNGVAGQEDCLFLNVFAPANAVGAKKSLPVMVYIHGGAFISGTGGADPDTLFDGSQLAGKGVVVVTLNYRLGALGFLGANHLGVLANGNFGLADQQSALNWVQSWIAQFGGNVQKITLFGESAGAMSVGLHLFDMTGSQTLFTSAIMQSNPMGEYYLPLTASIGPEAITLGQQYLDVLCADYTKATGQPCTGNWAQNVDYKTAVIDQTAFLAVNNNETTDLEKGLLGMRRLPWQPVVDKNIVSGEPLAGYFTGMPAKPYAFGINTDEGVLFAELLAQATMASSGNIQPLPPLVISDFPLDLQYNQLMDLSFGINESTVVSTPPYQPPATGPSYYSPAGVAFSNVVRDFMFDCGNEFVADNVVTKAPDVPVYAYFFSQDPYFDLYAAMDNGACAPGTGHVCHGNEIPYVFNSLTRIPGGGTPPGYNAGLAELMSSAWVAFAKHPDAPGENWRRYSATGPYAHTAMQFNTKTNFAVDLDKLGQCTPFWFTFGPYKSATR